jgi:hypothetical protein
LKATFSPMTPNESFWQNPVSMALTDITSITKHH